MYQSLFPRDVFASWTDCSADAGVVWLVPSIRGLGRERLSALNVGGTAIRGDLRSLGLDPATVESAAARPIPARREPVRRCRSEWVSADYHDGVLHISAKRRESARPRRIAVQ
jgi:HSP20 family protein